MTPLESREESRTETGEKFENWSAIPTQFDYNHLGSRLHNPPARENLSTPPNFYPDDALSNG